MPDTRPRHITSERGITGLETAIVMIAFVVVAAVFAFTVLSTGLFSSERGREAVYAGLAKTRGSLAISGGIIATSNGTNLTDLAITVVLAAGGESVSLSPSATNNRTVVGYRDTAVSDSDLTYTVTDIVGDNDEVLEPGEVMEIAIDLTQNPAIDLGPNETFSLELKPPSGSYIVVQRTLPPSVNDTIISLN